MSKIVLHRGLAGLGVGLRVGQGVQGNTTNGRQGKRPAFVAAHVVGKIGGFADITNPRCWRFLQIVERFQSSDRRRSGFGQGVGP